MSAAPPSVVAADLDATGRGGTPATEPEYRFDVERTVGMLARTLAALHGTPPALRDPSIPTYDPDALVERARTSVDRGLVTRESLSRAYRHMEPERLLEVLAERRPTWRPDDAVLTHGRPELANLHGSAGAALGFVGWERCGIADRYRDLAVASRSVAEDLGPMLVPVLLDDYHSALAGSPTTSPGDPAHLDPPRPDPVRLDWYALVAELTP